MRSHFVFLFISLLLSIYSCRKDGEESSLRQRSLIWDFPIERPHEGMLLGNGVQGVMVWGEENRLILTVSRAGFWDHRGSIDFATGTTYREIKWYLQQNNRDRLERALNISGEGEVPVHPHQIGGGRIIMDIPSDWKIVRGELILTSGEILITLQNEDMKERQVKIIQDPFRELTYLKLPPELDGKAGFHLVPSFDLIPGQFTSMGVSPPVKWKDDFEEGFCQYLPDDMPLALAWRKSREVLTISTVLAKDAARIVKDRLDSADYHESEKEAGIWWKDYWNDVPVINLPDQVLQEIADYGLYKQACSNPPQGIACSLQGPFMEAYQFPPWSNDYHFNINLEMIYWPALASNRTEHLGPMWNMLWSWMPQMKENAAHFFANDSALMIPHAVDDRGKVPGAFWTGMIDHGSTAWMAQLAWLNYRYTMDEQLLDTLAWPLLNGAFEGYWSMLDRIPLWRGGYRYSLAVSVSPEYRGSSMNAWGRDASFQLAAVHMLTSTLTEAARIKGVDPDPRWQDVAEHLPQFAVVNVPATTEYPGNMVDRIGLWEGLDLEDSHRHHSHLASIYPFCTIDPEDTLYRDIVSASVRHWIREGSGAWSGWSVPWASLLHSRTGNTEAAVGWLHYWKDHYTNKGRGTLHDADYPGFSTITSPCWEKYDGSMHEIMQLDAGFGALNAVFDLLVSYRQGIIHVLPGLHRDWKDLSFKGILTEGAFLVDATVKDGEIVYIRVTSVKGGELVLAPAMKGTILVNGSQFRGKIIRRKMTAGEVLELKAA